MKYILLALILLINSQILLAEDYKIDNIIISNTSTNAKEAKEKAIENGKIRAFHLLMKKIFSHSSIVPTESIDEIEFFISDFELINEKFSSKSYNAQMNINFNKSLIHQHFKDLHEPLTADKLAIHSGEALNYITCLTKVNTLQDWFKLQTFLQEKVKGINSVSPLSISSDVVIYEINFSISTKELAENLISHHISLIPNKDQIELKFDYLP